MASKRNGSVRITVKRYGCLSVEQCLKAKYRKLLPAEIFRQRRLSVSDEMEFYRRRAVHRENVATIISRAAFREPRRSAAPECSCARLLLMSATFVSPVTCMIPLHIVRCKKSARSRVCAVAQYTVLEANAKVNGRGPYSHPHPSETPHPISMSCQILSPPSSSAAKCKYAT